MMTNRRDIFTTVFGSRLYGTQTPNSDIDYKTIFMPSIKDLIENGGSFQLNTGTKEVGETRRNNSSDVDHIHWSFEKWFNLAKAGEMPAVDLLFTPVTDATPEWRLIHENRHLFFSKKNAQKIEKYVRGQLDKYGMKGSRVDELNRMHKILSDSKTMKEVLSKIPTDMKHVSESEELLHLFNKKFAKTDKNIKTALGAVEFMLNEYGERAKKASADTIDWKCYHHAARAIMVFNMLYIHGHFSYPILNSNNLKYLMDFKLGVYEPSVAMKHIERNLWDLMHYAEESGFPPEQDEDSLEELRMSVYHMAYGK